MNLELFLISFKNIFLYLQLLNIVRCYNVIGAHDAAQIELEAGVTAWLPPS